MTFRNRTFVVLLSLAALIEGATFIAVLNATHDNFIEQGSRELTLGKLVFDSALDNRARELVLGVGVLSRDFGFKSAVAGGDAPTIESALLNQGNRIAAELGLLIGRDRRIGASTTTIGGLANGDEFPFASLLNGSRGADSTMQGVYDLNGNAMQLVVAPVFAPDLIGWAAFGFAIDDVLAARIHRLTNLEVSFVADKGGAPRIIASTLPFGERESLVKSAQGTADQPRIVSSRGDEFLVVRRELGARGSTSVDALLSLSMAQVLSAYGALRLRLIVIMIAALALSTIAASLLANTVAEPLRRFAAAAKRISEGDYREPVSVNSRDELGTLSAAINDMQTGIEKREQKILYQATHDALTGLPNRRRIAELLSDAVSHAAAFGGRCAILKISLDGFKGINDTLGYTTGDAVLVELGRCLQTVCREGDTVARLGGDEFLLLLYGADEALGRRISKRVVDAVDDGLPVEGMQVRTTVRVGIACYPEHGDTAEDLQRRADIAMYAAADEGVPVAVYERGQDEDYLRRLKLVSELREAIESDALTLTFQPKLSLASNTLVAAEALVRWQHPRRGAISPEEFIPLAEQSGLIRDLTRSVLRNALASLRRWHDRGHPLRLAVNLSALDLVDDDLPKDVLEQLRRQGFPSDVLTLEITESAVMKDAVQAQSVLARLRSSGIGLSIDDFGTGQSSLAQLKSLPVDELKIDKSFVLDILGNEDDRTIVRSTIELGHNMGLSVTAEGVECAKSEALLRRFGCDVIQGYHLSPPLGENEFLEWLDARRADSDDAANGDLAEVDEASNDDEYRSYAG